MVYADDAGIVSRSSEGLKRMMTVIVTACSVFELIMVSEANTEFMFCGQQMAGRCRSPSIQPARYTNKRSRL